MKYFLLAQLIAMKCHFNKKEVYYFLVYAV